MEMGEEVVLTIECRALTEGTIINIAEVVSDTEDHDMDNNVDISVVTVEKENKNSPEVIPDNPKTSTMPATGTPILMVLLALLTLAGATLRRKI